MAQHDSTFTTMVIRDETDTDWEAGDYRVLVHCAGTGTIYAYVRLGTASQIAELPPCTAGLTTDAIQLHLVEAGHGSAVYLIPAGTAQAAVAYQIQRF